MLFYKNSTPLVSPAPCYYFYGVWDTNLFMGLQCPSIFRQNVDAGLKNGVRALWTGPLWRCSTIRRALRVPQESRMVSILPNVHFGKFLFIHIQPIIDQLWKYSLFDLPTNLPLNISKSPALRNFRQLKRIILSRRIT